MIFIFDWGHTTRKSIGPVAMSDLETRGKDDDYVVLVRYTSWFRVFFIPLIPTKRWYTWQNQANKTEVMASEGEKWLRLAKLNQMVVENRISPQDYHRQRAACVP